MGCELIQGMVVVKKRTPDGIFMASTTPSSRQLDHSRHASFGKGPSKKRQVQIVLSSILYCCTLTYSVCVMKLKRYCA